MTGVEAKKAARKARRTKGVTPLWTGTEWDPAMLERVYNACEKIAVGEMGLDIYRNQIEVISSEQMLDAYASIGMPIFYNHWSFGKSFSREADAYKAGKRGLAYELVINSNPCINYLMEENTATTQALVIAHAAFGHNAFFKNNYLFRTWTDADSIVDYLVFARDYVAQCEERHGQEQVELYLDSIHALSDYGVDRYKRPAKLSAAQEKERVREREAYLQSRVSTLYSFDPQETETVAAEPPWPAQPEENILYFIEKNAPDLKGWQRELIRIVRKINQYFYPQGQTKLMNEGFASWIHYTIMNTLHDRGLTTDGAHLEFLHLHSSVLFQPGFNDPRYGGLNPYKLGFDMLIDIERICREPTEEDRRWFPALIGQDPLEIIKDAVANYRDESFVRQFLSPHLIRQWKMFRVHDKRDSPFYEVQAIHNDRGYHDIRDSLADSYEWHAMRPQIEVTRANRRTRALTLTHTPYRGRSLANPEAVMRHIRHLWGYPVELRDNHDWLISEIK